jgi:hypothetical protein
MTFPISSVQAHSIIVEDKMSENELSRRKLLRSVLVGAALIVPLVVSFSRKDGLEISKAQALGKDCIKKKACGKP